MTTLSLRTYLESRRTTSADWNITGMGSGPNGWLGKFQIPDDEYDAFLHLVHDHVFVKGRACSLLEKHKPTAPILVDLDFRYASGGPLRRRFSTDHIRQFVAAYADAIGRFFEPTAEPLQFYVMLKPAPEADTARDNHKDGIHIVCPTLTTSPELQYAIRGWLLQTGAIERIFAGTGMTNPAQECLDISVIQKNNWFLYGACKPDKPWYKVEHVYGVQIPATAEPITVENLEEEAAGSMDTLDLVKRLSIRMDHDVLTAMTLRTHSATVETEWLQLLQRWGKGSNWSKAKSPGLFAKVATTQEVDAIPPIATLAPEDMIQISGMSVRSGPTEANIKLAYKLVDECFNPTHRAKVYTDWVRFGLLLHNIAANDTSYELWKKVSRRVPGYEQEPDSTFKEKWALLPTEASALQRGVKPLTIATIHHYAKEDNYTRYRKIMDKAQTEFALLNYSGTHVSVAELVFDMYQHEFRCTPLRKGATASSMDWYQYSGSSWRNLKSAMRIRERLSNDVRNKYLQAGSEARDQCRMAPDQESRERLDDKIKKLNKLESSLQSSSFKDSVMKEVTEKFYDEEFLQNMNQDPCTIAFNNGVLELRHPGADGQPHVFFRPGRPDDCISFQMGRGISGHDAYDYIPYDPAAPHPCHIEIQQFFEKIYPDPVLREYCLTLYSACLEGANREQKFYILTGGGSNGKSKIVELMSKTFGEYQETLATTALTRKRADAGSANPELIVLKCKRFVSMSEPDEGEKINTASMKQLSGEDVVKARALFQDQDQFVVMARIFMLCNDLPPVSSMDNGTWRRLRVIPHVAKFVDPGMPTDASKHVHTKDMMLEGKIVRWRPYFAGMLVWYYENHYLRHGLKEPAQVTAASNKYKEENDAFAAFCQECLVREVGAELRANDALIQYKEWCRFNPGKKQLQKKDLLQKLGEIYGAPIEGGKVFTGIRIAMEGEDVSGNVIGGV